MGSDTEGTSGDAGDLDFREMGFHRNLLEGRGGERTSISEGRRLPPSLKNTVSLESLGSGIWICATYVVWKTAN